MAGALEDEPEQTVSIENYVTGVEEQELGEGRYELVSWEDTLQLIEENILTRENAIQKMEDDLLLREYELRKREDKLREIEADVLKLKAELNLQRIQTRIEGILLCLYLVVLIVVAWLR